MFYFILFYLSEGKVYGQEGSSEVLDAVEVSGGSVHDGHLVETRRIRQSADNDFGRIEELIKIVRDTMRLQLPKIK